MCFDFHFVEIALDILPQGHCLASKLTNKPWSNQGLKEKLLLANPHFFFAV